MLVHTECPLFDYSAKYKSKVRNPKLGPTSFLEMSTVGGGERGQIYPLIWEERGVQFSTSSPGLVS